MTSDYESINREHQLDYGRKLPEWAQDHLANRYTDRTHFIFELLQNAEDALQERGESKLPTSVAFDLHNEGLEIRHFGAPFTSANVKSICAINESTKKDELTEIGRFGIGFKSVYAFTNRPEIHSADEHFAIEKFVLPVAIAPRELRDGETLFWIPFSQSDVTAVREISSALSNLGSRRLLFLEHIDEISWSLPNDSSGVFLKGQITPKEGGHLIQLLGEVSETSKKEEEEWLVFSRKVNGPEGNPAGSVAIGFLLGRNEEEKHVVQAVPDSRLIVFFPTDVPTGTGFLIQGPYRTTPSRDNVPLNDSWNRKLVETTAELLVLAMKSLRDAGFFLVEALQVLPIDTQFFRPDSMFFPLFEQVRTAFMKEPLLPVLGNRHLPASQARLARTEGIRELFSPRQLAQLLGVKPDIYWLSDEITKDRAASIRNYLIDQLGIPQITPDYLQSRLSVAFLTVQSDDWIRRFYGFLSGQNAVLAQLLRKGLAFVRCEDNTHAVPIIRGLPQVFLPSEGVTGFRTVKRSVCTPKVVEFLRRVGLSEPDPVDDVIQNVLNHYSGAAVSRNEKDYESDIRRVLNAFHTDSDQGRRKLVEALRDSSFVRAVDAKSKKPAFVKPEQTYRSTQRLKTVFSGVGDVWIVDDRWSALRGEPMRDLLQATGAFDVLRTTACEPTLNWKERRAIRLQEGNESSTSDWIDGDTDCPELEPVLNTTSQLTGDNLRSHSSELWLLLRETLRDRREAYFQATYKWSYMRREFSSIIPATWVRRLQRARWIPDAQGQARAPHEICLSDVDHNIRSSPSPFLAEALEFRAEAIKQLAEKEGIDLEVLNLLKKHKISVAQIRELISTQPDEQAEAATDDSEDDPDAEVDTDTLSENKVDKESDVLVEDEEFESNGGFGPGSGEARTGKSTTIGTGSPRRTFQTYVGVDNGGNVENDDLPPDKKREIEAAAISFIVAKEPLLQRTSNNNPGFDLFEGESLEFIVRFVEVKAKAGAWDGAIALSGEQFRLAENEGERFWIYVVEFAEDARKRRLHKIQDPVGKARYFTFDPGWKALAEDQTERTI